MIPNAARLCTTTHRSPTKIQTSGYHSLRTSIYIRYTSIPRSPSNSRRRRRGREERAERRREDHPTTRSRSTTQRPIDQSAFGAEEGSHFHNYYYIIIVIFYYYSQPANPPARHPGLIQPSSHLSRPASCSPLWPSPRDGGRALSTTRHWTHWHWHWHWHQHWHQHQLGPRLHGGRNWRERPALPKLLGGGRRNEWARRPYPDPEGA